MTNRKKHPMDFVDRYSTNTPLQEVPHLSRAEANKLVAAYRRTYRGLSAILDEMHKADRPPEKICSWHRRNDLDYVTWHNWAFEQSSLGRKQRQCPDCQRYFFKSEWGKRP